MSKRRRWFWRLAPVGLWCLCVAGYFVWGGLEGRRFDERVAALRAAGRLRTLEALHGAPAPEGQNGYARLEVARENLRTLEGQWREHLENEGHDPWEMDRWSPDEPCSKEVRQYAEQKLEFLAPYFEQLEAVLERPVLQAPFPEDGARWEHEAEVSALLAGQQLYRAARLDPPRAPACVDAMVALVRRCRAVTPSSLLFRAVLWRALVARGVRHALAEASVDAARTARWSRRLAEAEVQLLADLEGVEAYRRATILWMLEAWRAGRDPWADLRPDEAPEAEGETSSASDPCLELLRGLPDLPDPGWRATWYGRPWLLHEAHSVLDAIDAAPVGAWDLARLRTQLGAASPEAADERRWRPHRTVLHAVATLRLTCVLLADGPWRDDARTTTQRLEALEAALVSSLPHDPLADAPLRVRVEGGALVVSCDATSELLRSLAIEPAELEDEGLLVRLPLRR